MASSSSSGNSGTALFSVDTAQVRQSGVAIDRCSIRVASGPPLGRLQGAGEGEELAGAMNNFSEAWMRCRGDWRQNVTQFATATRTVASAMDTDDQTRAILVAAHVAVPR